MIRIGRSKPKNVQSVIRGMFMYARLLSFAGVLISVFIPKAWAASLPVACGGSACVTKGGPSQWITGTGRATPSQSGTTLNIHQETDKVVLNWEQFNIDAGYAVNFQQPGATSVAVNRVWDPTTNPSTIQGSLTANGQVYLINRNGIVFGKDARVNTHTFIASSVDITDKSLNEGILSGINDTDTPLPSFEGTNADSVGVQVHAGAELTAAAQGKIMLFGGVVQNDGTIKTADGQIILAAGNKIYLQASTDPDVRGLWVEVDHVDASLPPQVTNTGTILSERGNITLMGLAVNQSGRITATSSIAANGSVRLLARSGYDIAENKDKEHGRVIGNTGGALEFGATSVTEILLADDGKTAAKNTLFGTDGNALNPSIVEAMGAQIHLQSGSTITAAGGEVSLTAAQDPHQLLTNRSYNLDTTNDSAIRIDSGAVIDVSGVTAGAAMSRNQLEIFLTQNELNDYEQQRDGVLYRETVYVDARKGSTVANIQPYIDNVAITVSEKAAQGGRVLLNSEGRVDVAAGSKIDVSGGQVNVAAGYLKTTQLVADGRLYDISNADPNRRYDGVAGTYSRVYKKWGVVDERSTTTAAAGNYQRAYTEGKSAGTLSVQGHEITLKGELIGHTVAGDYQRDPATAPKGGQLIVGATESRATVDNGMFTAFRAPSVQFTHNPALAALDHPESLLLDTRFIDEGGFTRLEINSDGKIDVPREMTLNVGPGGSVKLLAREVTVDGDIHAAGGAITLRTTNFTGDTNADHHALTLGEYAQLDVAGRWVNDNPEIASTTASPGTWIKGGNVTLQSADDLALKSGSTIDASGGAWLKADGSLKSGDGGSIDIQAHTFSGKSTPADATLELGAQLSAWSLGKGGKLAIKADRIAVGTPEAATALTDNTTVINPEFFQQGGFGSYTLTAGRGSLDVLPGTQLNLIAKNRVIDNAAYRRAPTGTSIAALTRETELRPDQRAAVNLTLKHDPRAAGSFGDAGSLTVGEGARISTEAGGTLSLSSGTRMLIDGDLSAPGGKIDLALFDPSFTGAPFLYEPTHTLWVGERARLSTAGAVKYTPTIDGTLRGEVLDGGTISALADAGTLVVDTGAQLDVSGTHAPLDLPTADGGRRRAEVASRAGSIELQATESMEIAGSLVARPGHEQSSGGTLRVSLDLPGTDVRNSLRNLIVTSANDAPAARAPLSPEAPLLDENNGVGILRTTAFADGGFDMLDLRSAARLTFDGDVNLDMERSVTLAAPVIDVPGNTRIHAAYVALENATSDGQALASLGASGTGELFVSADKSLNLRGRIAVDQANRIELRSGGDIRMSGVQRIASDPVLGGALKTHADVTLQANQIYPTTLANYTVQVSGDNGTITVLPGAADSPVLSAGGRLHLDAANIVQSGVLKAPLGAIELSAHDTLTLAPGSITSVSAENQLIPFGRTENGTDWLYDLPIGDLKLLLDAPPEKKVALTAPTVDVQDGATIDLSGGGDVLAYEMLPLTNNPKDVFAGADGKERYAILPSLKNGVAPYDPMYSSGSKLQAGDSIYLSGVSGLADGEYTLLPARYALLPGAYVVEPLSGYRDLTPGQSLTRLDGATVAYGVRTVAGTGIRDSRSNGFLVRPGTVTENADGADVFTYGASRYALTGGNAHFAEKALHDERAIPRLAQDAGDLTLAAQSSLTLDGELRVQNSSGRGATVNITGERIAVVGDAADAAAGYVAVDADQLNQLGAESVLIGGTRAATADGIHIAVAATEVRIGDDVTLHAPELLLAARDEVNVGAGAQLRGEGGNGVMTNVIAVDGDGALLRATSARQSALQRNYEDGTAIGTSGTLNIGAGAVIAGKSVILDASKDIKSEGSLALAAGGSLNLGASQINLGDVPQGTPGFTLSNTQLQQLNADELVLTSRGGVDIYGATTLNARMLTIDAPAFTGHGLSSGDTATLQAERLVFTNHNTTTAAASLASGNGTLHADTGTTEFAQGDYTIAGFDQVRFDARNEILGSGAANVRVGGELTLAAPRVTGTSGADLAITSADAQARAIRILAARAPAEQLANNALGASLKFTGARIAVDGNIEAKAGEVRLIANGTSADDDVALSDAAVVDVSAVARNFADITKFADAGKVVFESGAGDVIIAAGARVNLAGVVSDKPGRGGGDAGELTVYARQGQAQLNGNIDAHAIDDARGGRIELDVKSLSGDYATLDAQLRDAGFTEQQHLRVRTGDINVATQSAQNIVAHDYQLVADQGSVNVHATVDASGNKGGNIEIWSGKNLTVHGDAELLARAEGENARGGKVVLAAGGLSTASTRVGQLDVQAGARIDVSGTGTKTQSGSVILRAPATASGVAIGTLAPTIQGAKEVVVEAVKIYNATTLDEATQLNLKTATADYMTASAAQAATLKAQLGASGANFSYRPGVEVRSSGDLTVSNALDLHEWRYGSAADVPGTLTLRAQGDLKFQESLSDGFASTDHKARINDAGESWSYRLVGGADLGSADALATLPYVSTSTGNVIIEAGTKPTVVGQEAVKTKLVRTGTGDIDVAAARDVVLKNQQSMIYTAGATVARKPTALDNGTAFFAQDGGDVSLHAGGDIRMAQSATVENPDQLITAWLHREGGQAGNKFYPASWWVNSKYFQQNIGALGGGDVMLAAGRDVANVSAVVATSKLAASAEILGGGDLNVDAGRDIKGGVFYVGKGDGRIDASGSVREYRSGPGALGSVPIYPILALGDARIKINARQDLKLSTVLNPTSIWRSAQQENAKYSDNPAKRSSFLFSYSATSGVDAVAVAGNLRFENDTPALKDVQVSTTAKSEIDFKGSAELAYVVYPPSLNATAMEGDIEIAGPMHLFPAATGTLELMAKGSVVAGNARVVLSDADVDLLPTIDNPMPDFVDAVNQLGLLFAKNHAVDAVHQDDPDPVRVIALEGDVSGGEYSLAKHADIRAGRDIRDVDLTAQNVSDSDATSIYAGRDVVYNTARSANKGILANPSGITVLGPGELNVQAGRDIDLGSSRGIVSEGNLNNLALPDGGANVVVVAGVDGGIDYAELARHVLPKYQPGSIELTTLTQSLRIARQNPELTEAEVLAKLQQDPNALGRDLLFNEMKQAVANGKNDYPAGHAAIDTVFSGSQYDGDINLYLSQIRTQDGGDIDLFAPGGLVNAGLAANLPSFNKTPEVLGIVAQSLGRVRAYTQGDFLVNQSRVFTLRGGDLLLWSREGNIDAGRGAKSVSAAPQPEYRNDAQGNTFVILPAAAQGSGIGIILSGSNDLAGDATLVAPVGEVNAGDAGIAVAGNLNISAQTVTGADNIKVGGVATGVPIAGGSDLGGGFTGLSNPAGEATKRAEEAMADVGNEDRTATPLSDAALTFLEIEVLGYGENGCGSDDANKENCEKN